MDKLFDIAGTSTLNGVSTYRFATGKVNVRVAKLKRHGHTDVDLVQLPRQMTREEAMAYLAEQGRQAVLPKVGRSKAAEQERTPEEIAAEKEKAEKAEFVARMKAARAAKAAARLNAENHNFIAELTGDAKVEVPELEPDEHTEGAAVAETKVEDNTIDELLALVTPANAEG